MKINTKFVFMIFGIVACQGAVFGMVIRQNGFGVGKKKGGQSSPEELLTLGREFASTVNNIKFREEFNVIDSDGNSLLHIAAKVNFVNIANHLLNIDVNPNVQNNEGDFPLDVAAQYCSTGVADLLIERKAPWNKKFYESYSNIDAVIAQSCKERGLEEKYRAWRLQK